MLNQVSQMTKVRAHLAIQEIHPFYWPNGSFDSQEVKSRMIRNGWCPSDLLRTKNKFTSLQALHFLSMLDKSQPERSHTSCDDEQCQAYQIDPKTYGLSHVEEDCQCKYIAINNADVIAALKDGDSIPLLRFVGTKDDLKIEVVKSSIHTPYVAISHVSSYSFK
jgi:hypothetical protein